MSKPNGERYRISVDFDGVIHSYTTPWINAWTIPDPPVPGAIEWLNKIRAKFDVVIFTTRAAEPDGAKAVHEWLIAHGANAEPQMHVTNEKIASLIYIDDRGWRFDGTFPTAQQIHQARPWNKRLKVLSAR